MPYVNFRWLGGMLTNFRTIHKRIQRMRELEDMEQTRSPRGSSEEGSSPPQARVREAARATSSGLEDLDKAPDAVYILDTKKEEIAVREARKLGIPVVAVLDTNCDPDEVDYGIPGNDDAIRSGALLTRIIADAVIEGKAMRAETTPGGRRGRSRNGRRRPRCFPSAAEQPKAEWELQLEAEESQPPATDRAQSPSEADRSRRRTS